MSYRQIHTEIWDDPWFIRLNPQEKLLFVYLFSNSRTNTIGLYEISPLVIAFETGLDPDTISASMDRFAADGKVLHEGSWVWVPRLLTRNVINLKSGKIQTMIEKQLLDVPNSCPFKADWIVHYNTVIVPQYGIDTLPELENGIDTLPHPQIPSVVCCGVSESVSVSESVIDYERDENDEPTAIKTWLDIRAGAVNPLDVQQIGDLAAEFEEHRQGLPRGSPGAALSGDEWVREAMLVANGARDGSRIIRLNYIKGILGRWKDDGYKAPFRGKDGDQDEGKVQGL